MILQMLGALAHPGDAIKDVVIPLVSGLGGAVLGAMISYFASSRLARQASAEMLKRDAEARHDQNIRAAHQIYVKLSMAANMLCGYHKQVEEMAVRPDIGATEMRLCDKLSTFAGIELGRPVEFTPEELSIYIAAKRADYIDDLLLLARHHAINLAHLATFAKLKIELQYEILEAGTTNRSKSGVSNTRLLPSHPRFNLIMAKRDELDLFAHEMRKLLDEGDKLARCVAGKFNEVTAAFLGKEMTLDFEAVDETGST